MFHANLFKINFYLLVFLFMGNTALHAKLNIEKKANQKELAFFSSLSFEEKRDWYNLLYYKKNMIIDGFESLADGKFFFLSGIEGKSDPSLEFNKSIEAFLDGNKKAGKFSYHPQCTFPERYFFIKKVLKDKDLSFVDKDCPNYKEFKEGIDAKALILIFSSSYPNNPASSFGHTFFRFKQHKNKGSDLLDYSASYSARVKPSDNGLFYAFKGMFGGYPGFFDFSPYYLKVNEYSHSESRDLIEYELNLTQNEVDRVIGSLWEIYNSTHFDYFFLSENCSYLLGRVLKIIKPNWNEIDNWRWFFLPSDLVHAVNFKKERVRNIVFRPSLKKKLEEKLKKLNKADLLKFKKLINNQLKLDSNLSTQLLDSISKYLHYEKNKKKGILTQEQNTLFRDVLLARAKKGIKSKEDNSLKKWPMKNRPELAHRPSTLDVSILKNSRSDYLDYRLGIEMGHYNLSSPSIGVDPFFDFRFLGLYAHYNKEIKKIRLSEFHIIGITSLHNYSFYDSQPSWHVEAKVDLSEKNNEFFDLEAAAGYSYYFSLFKNESVVYMMSDLFWLPEISKWGNKNWDGGLGLKGVLLFELFNEQKLSFSSHYRSNFLSKKDEKGFFNTMASYSKNLKKSLEMKVIYRYDMTKFKHLNTKGHSFEFKTLYYF